MSLRAREFSRRRRLSLTSLIDVIFLLLLFFMLSSTFTRFAEFPLLAAVGGEGDGGVMAAPDAPAAPPLFLRLREDRLDLNGVEISLPALLARVEEGGPQAILISLSARVSSQRLADLLVRLQPVPGLIVTVLE